jgi:hypothetical protein
VSAWDDIVDRAIEYTEKLLHINPGHAAAAVESLRSLRENLAKRAPDDDPALDRLDAYVKNLTGRLPP